MVIISRLRSSIRQLSFWILICSLGTGCATTEKEEIVKKEESKKPKPTHSSLVVKKKQTMKHSAPLPSYIPVDHPLFLGEFPIGEGAAFLAWDFNRDGRIDMVEKYRSEGKVDFRAFDFDFDGKVDLKVGSDNAAHIYFKSGESKRMLQGKKKPKAPPSEVPPLGAGSVESADPVKTVKETETEPVEKADGKQNIEEPKPETLEKDVAKENNKEAKAETKQSEDAEVKSIKTPSWEAGPTKEPPKEKKEQ